MSKIKDTLDFEVKYFTGQEEGEDDVGYPYYVATCSPVGIVTYGENFEVLLSNLREALAAALDEEDTIALYNVIPTPRLVLHMEIPHPHAKTA